MISRQATEKYFQRAKRVAAGSDYDGNGKVRGFRSRMTAGQVALFVSKADLALVEQNRALVNKKGDVITIFQKQS